LKLQEIMDISSIATHMELSVQKSTSCFHGLELESKERLKRIFIFKHLEFNDEFKYLSFILKPDSYKKIDWGWILEKIEGIIKTWCNRWLSIGGD
jgi:hypothetical protein